MGYKIGKVYRIVKVDDPTINYIGSTFSELKLRWSLHKKTSNCSIGEYFDEYGKDKFKIILIKEYVVYAENQKDTKHLRAYEQLWINKFTLKKSCINKVNALNYLKKEKYKEYKKKYYENNKDKISQKIECSICKSLISKKHLSRHQKTKKCANIKSNTL